MIATSNGYIMFYKDNSLSFEVRGTQFPNPVVGASNSYFILRLYGNQKVTVNYGDGEIGEHSNADAVGRNALGWSWNGLPQSGDGVTQPGNIIQPHIYQDGNSGKRIITFNFEDITQVYQIGFFSVLVEGVIPSNLVNVTGLVNLTLNNTQGITEFPRQLGGLTNLRMLNIGNFSPNILDQIPDSLFDLKLQTFQANGVFNLADPNSSNLFKVNQWASTLEDLQLQQCNITRFDETFRELTKLTGLRLAQNPLEEMPNGLENMTELRLLYLQYPVMLDFTNLNKLEILLLSSQELDLTTIPILWVGLVSLTRISSFANFVNNSRVSEFVENFYELCTTNGSIVPGGAAAPYPNRFRNISWGYGTMILGSPKVAPDGYEQGVSNGDAVTAGEKAYVLQNQYNHTITHA